MTAKKKPITDTQKAKCNHCGSDKTCKRGMQNGRQRYFCNECRKYFKIMAVPQLFKELDGILKIVKKGNEIVKRIENKSPPQQDKKQILKTFVKAFEVKPSPTNHRRITLNAVKAKPEPKPELIKQRVIPKEWFSSTKPIKSTLKPATVPVKANPVYLWVDHKQNFHIGGTPPSDGTLLMYRKILTLYDPGRDMIALKRAIIKYETAHGIKNGIII